VRWILFLSKLAFICNLFFLASFVLQVTDWLHNAVIVSYIIIIGWFFAVLFNVCANASCLAVFLANRKKLSIVPAWLLVVNILFLILQLVFLFLMNVNNY
jgi:hypothetical protein